MRRPSGARLTAASIGVLAAGAAVLLAQGPAGPTFNQDVAPILFANCVSCHRPGEVAPMSLLTFDSARPWASAIKAKVLAREMPPWPPDPRYGQFRNAHVLTDAQIPSRIDHLAVCQQRAVRA